MEERLVLRLVLTDKEAIEFFSNVPRRLKATAVEQGLRLLKESEIGRIFGGSGGAGASAETGSEKKTAKKDGAKVAEQGGSGTAGSANQSPDKTQELIDKNLDIVNNLPKNSDRAW